MFKVLGIQIKRLLKNPVMFLVNFGLTLAFVLVIGASQEPAQIQVSTYTSDLHQSDLNQTVENLNQNDSFNFEIIQADQAREDLRMNRVPFVLDLQKNDYTLWVAREDGQVDLVDNYLKQKLGQEESIRQVRDQFPQAEIDLTPTINLENQYLEGEGQGGQAYQFQALIGQSLFFVTLTVFFLQSQLLEERTSGVWSRLIVSPLSKVQIYLGNLVHYYLAGVLQLVLSFIILTRLLGIEFGPGIYPMAVVILVFLFAIVALGILLVSISPSLTALNALIPIVTVAMAMLGGAFWPLEIVSNRFLLTLAEFIPIKHAMQGALSAINGQLELGDLGQVILILALMGVLFMGVGLNLMERQRGQ
ncbi:ABC-type transport system involved in multi-copper enzyme maturation, permease component [Alloiococcus otitis]|uniref:ABC transmembrane type-2 domain-containing protein n=1 Tax=Alloiococcus otitis ATCC 51267 TaxID=883081 RepID=K9EA46_9LACT|nr:ABC transporter permease [Alloiococcus otitis]EKU94099.1 hypothetical protein HMPREF9698_00411 [Alloiococcus otitis ATCC 51267]SUU80987.1 ABC-type transport system involved in multi-copper enzyme maturation, permease component [Alloiococcus otitis]